MLRTFRGGALTGPNAPENIEVNRKDDHRNANSKWEPVEGALNKDQAYYFQVETFNENGVGTRSEVVRIV